MGQSGKLGIDIAQEKFDVALQVADREYEGSFANQPSGFRQLSSWLAKQKVEQVHACLEATGRYGEELAIYLYEQGHVVSVVNPARVKKYGESQLRRNKSDRQDARLILDFLIRQGPPAWTPPPVEQRELQAMVRHLDDLKRMQQQERNRLHAGAPGEVVRQTLEEHIAFLAGQIERLQQQINDHINRHPKLKRQRQLLDSIPGIGDITAARILAEVPDINRFPSAREMAAYAGLTPRHWESGKSVRKPPRLSKVGNATLRTALYMPAVVAIHHNPLVRELAERLQARGKSKMCIVGAAMRKLLHIAYGVLKSGQPFDPQIGRFAPKTT